MDKLTVRQVQNIGMKLATFEYWKLNTQTWKSVRGYSANWVSCRAQ